ITIGKILSQDTNDLGIGARPETKKASSGDPFSGSIDEVRIYNYALDANEIAWLATDGTGYRRLRSQANLYDLELPLS
ncbi:MAG: LamG-like jellyroll fold domain-containing protein, partial [Planctomycetota bacterium]